MVDTHNHNLIREYTYRFVVVVGRHLKMSNDEFDVLHSTLFSTWPFFFSPWLTHTDFCNLDVNEGIKSVSDAKTQMFGLVRSHNRGRRRKSWDPCAMIWDIFLGGGGEQSTPP